MYQNFGLFDKDVFENKVVYLSPFIIVETLNLCMSLLESLKKISFELFSRQILSNEEENLLIEGTGIRT